MKVIDNLSEVLLVRLRQHRYDIDQSRNAGYAKSMCGQSILEKHHAPIGAADENVVEICEECQQVEAVLVAEARSIIHGRGHHRDGPITACGQNARPLVTTAKPEEITCRAYFSCGPGNIWG